MAVVAVGLWQQEALADNFAQCCTLCLCGCDARWCGHAGQRGKGHAGAAQLSARKTGACTVCKPCVCCVAVCCVLCARTGIKALLDGVVLALIKAMAVASVVVALASCCCLLLQLVAIICPYIVHRQRLSGVHRRCTSIAAPKLRTCYLVQEHK